MEPNSDVGISESDVSAIFERHAFDPWLPGNRQRNCLYVMDRMAFAAAVREAIAAKTRQLVDALRPITWCIEYAPHGEVASVPIAWLTKAERLVAEFDAHQRPAFGDGQAAFDAAQQKGTTDEADASATPSP